MILILFVVVCLGSAATDIDIALYLVVVPLVVVCLTVILWRLLNGGLLYISTLARMRKLAARAPSE